MSMIPSRTTPPVDPNQGGIVDIEPIPQVVVGSRNLPTYSLGPDFQFTERAVTPGATALVGTSPIYGQNYFVQRGAKTYYRGPGLVDGNGVIKRDPYDPSEINTEAYRYLASLDRGERIARLNFFADKWTSMMVASRSTSTFDSRDLNATSQYLLALNRWGVTDDIGLAFLQTEISWWGMGGGRTIRVTAKEDITKVLTEESFRLLGRPMSAKEVREAVQFVQSRERQAAMGGAEQAPALSTLTELPVTRGRGSETQLEGFRTLADLLEQALGGG
jgi:hypothetical protein